MGGGEGISRGRGVIIGSLRHLKLGFKKKKKKKKKTSACQEKCAKRATENMLQTTFDQPLT